MNTIGNKIRNIRKSKGFSQEYLAEQAKVNVRTIQRIETGENTPHGKTLQLICEVLGIHPNEILEYNLKEDKIVLMWIFFSVASTLVLPLGNVIVPLILWINNKHRITNADRVGKNIMYNQIIFSVFTFLFWIAFAYQKINHIKAIDLPTLFTFYVLFLLINIGYTVFAGIKAYNGKIILYPFFRNSTS